MISALDQELHQYISQLSEAEKTSVLQLLKTFLSRDTAIDIEEYNREIDEALEQVSTGNYISQEEMERKAAKW